MPACIPTLPPLPAAVSQATVESCRDTYPDDWVKHTILHICASLLALDTRTRVWKTPKSSPYNISLSTLCDRLYTGKLAPGALKLHSCSSTSSSISSELRATIDNNHWNRPLEDFEDLYYSLLAKIKDVHQMIELQVNNGFKSPTDIIFEQGPIFAELHDMLASDWHMLNEPELVKTLDLALQSRMAQALCLEIRSKLEVQEVTASAANGLLADLHKIAENGEIAGLAWIGGWAPSMIVAWLEEKYRMVLKLEREGARRDKHEKRVRKTKEKDRRKLEMEQAERERHANHQHEMKTKRQEKKEAEHQRRIRKYKEQERKVVEEEHFEREERWKKDYEEQMDKWEIEQMEQMDQRETAFQAKKADVESYCLDMRAYMGGENPGLPKVWTVYGRP